MSAFDDLQSIPPQLLADGYLARAVHGEELTLAVVEVAPGAELPEHRHANEQFGMVIEGSVIFCIGDETRTLKPGGIWRIPSQTPHTVTGGDVGAVVVDIFSPVRDDWAARERLEPQPTRWPSASMYRDEEVSPGHWSTAADVLRSRRSSHKLGVPMTRAWVIAVSTSRGSCRL